MFDFWSSILFLCIGLPISLIIMALLGYADAKQQEYDQADEEDIGERRVCPSRARGADRQVAENGPALPSRPREEHHVSR